jgi:hypothetical protein
MAKHVPQQDPADIVIFFARARGGGAVVAQSVQALTDAIQQATQPQFVTRVQRALPSKTTANDKIDQQSLFDADGDGTFGPEEMEVVDVAGMVTTATDGKTAKARKAPTYTFVKDLNLRPDGSPSLRDFFAEKKPPDQQSQFAVIVYYLTKILGLSNVSVNHVYAALKDVGKRVPSDIAQIARNTANRKGWLDSSDSNDLKVTTGGENYVEQDLPKQTE